MDDATYAAAVRRTGDRHKAILRDAIQELEQLIKERKAIRARNDVWFESAVMEPYREAGSPYGEGTSPAIRWFREQYKKKHADE